MMSLGLTSSPTDNRPVYKTNHMIIMIIIIMVTTDVSMSLGSTAAGSFHCSSFTSMVGFLILAAVSGAAARFGIPFEDPKASDGTPVETATYDDRCAGIAREMSWVMTRAAGR